MSAYERTIAHLQRARILDGVSHLLNGPYSAEAMRAIVHSVARAMRGLIDVGDREFSEIERAVTFDGITRVVSIDVVALARLVPEHIQPMGDTQRDRLYAAGPTIGDSIDGMRAAGWLPFVTRMDVASFCAAPIVDRDPGDEA